MRRDFLIFRRRLTQYQLLKVYNRYKHKTSMSDKPKHGELERSEVTMTEIMIGLLPRLHFALIKHHYEIWTEPYFEWTGCNHWSQREKGRIRIRKTASRIWRKWESRKMEMWNVMTFKIPSVNLINFKTRLRIRIDKIHSISLTKVLGESRRLNWCWWGGMLTRVAGDWSRYQYLVFAPDINGTYPDHVDYPQHWAIRVLIELIALWEIWVVSETLDFVVNYGSESIPKLSISTWRWLCNVWVCGGGIG